MAQPYVGQVIAVGFNFTPAGWLPCNGALVAISQFDVLFALIGTTYGGDGVNTFALPNLQGRAAVGQGQGPGLSNYILGQVSGTETVTLTTPNLPTHTHVPQAAANGTTSTPGGSVVFGASTDNASLLYAAPSGQTNLNNAVVGQSNGSNQPHDNLQPFQTINYVISAFGVFPSRN